jgi:hypothetical protein
VNEKKGVDPSPFTVGRAIALNTRQSLRPCSAATRRLRKERCSRIWSPWAGIS